MSNAETVEDEAVAAAPAQGTKTSAKQAKPSPAGYVAEGPLAARWDGKAHGLGVVTFGEPTFGRYLAINPAYGSGGALAGHAALLRAVARHAPSLPKPDAPQAAYATFIEELGVRAGVALVEAANYFLRQLEDGAGPEGNGSPAPSSPS